MCIRTAFLARRALFRAALVVLGYLSCVSVSYAQEANVDLGTTFNAPSDTHGGAGQQPGHWNEAGDDFMTLDDLSGSPSDINLSVFVTAEFGSDVSNLPSNDAEELTFDNVFSTNESWDAFSLAPAQAPTAYSSMRLAMSTPPPAKFS
jgi:hypothetical protein